MYLPVRIRQQQRNEWKEVENNARKKKDKNKHLGEKKERKKRKK
jgi:hypothetical protein